MVRNQLTPTQAQARRLPALYATDGAPVKIAVVRYFFGGRGAFYAVEFGPSENPHVGGGVFFGYGVFDSGEQEYCYMSLTDLKTRRAERDLHFSPKPLGDACKQYADPLPFDLA
tara:strand:+ start:4218 stop:4559 length:342 start_codon:yes stop_codon:yes gene_type:complete